MKNKWLTKAMHALLAIVFIILAGKNLMKLPAALYKAWMETPRLVVTLVAATLVLAALVCFAIWLCKRRIKIRISTAALCAILFAVTYILRAVWAAIAQTPIISDYQLFYWVANQIGRGEPLYLTDIYFERWAYQTGFPAFMSPVAALFPGNGMALVYVNLLFEAGTVVCVFWLLIRRLPRRISFLLCLIYLTMPFPLMLAPAFTNQFAATFFMLLGVCVTFTRPRENASPKYHANTTVRLCIRCAVGAVLVAVSNMLRPEGIIFAAAIAALALLVFISHKAGLRERLTAAAPYLACIPVYLLTAMLISQIFVWTNLNPHGLQNDYPLYKFVIGLNEENGGLYNNSEVDYLMQLYDSQPDDIRDAESMSMINERLSIGPVRLLDLFSRKADIMWTPSGEYAAFQAYEDGHMLTVAGLSVGADKLSHVIRLYDCLWMLALFAACAVAQIFAFKRKDADPLFCYLSLFAGAALAVFCVVEVQRRYGYLLMPVLFVMATYIPVRRSKDKAID